MLCFLQGPRNRSRIGPTGWFGTFSYFSLLSKILSHLLQLI